MKTVLEEFKKYLGRKKLKLDTKKIIKFKKRGEGKN